MFHSSHLGGGHLGADPAPSPAGDAPAPSAPPATVPAVTPAPIHPAFPFLTIGAIAIITYFVMCSIKDGNKSFSSSTGE